MDKPIHILLLEDNPTDAELVQRELRKAGFDFKAQWAPDKGAFLQALDSFAPDIVLADYLLPGFDGLAALALARQRFAEIPVIVVSGAVGEEVAIETLKAGATDYVLKDRLSRLGPVVRRALQEAEQLVEKKRADAALREAHEHLQGQAEELRAANEELQVANEELQTQREELQNQAEELAVANEGLRESQQALRESEEKHRIVADFTHNCEYWRSPDSRLLYVSPSCERVTGYGREEFIRDPELFLRIVHPDDRQRVREHWHQDQFHSEPCELEFRIVRRDGQERWIGHACRGVLDEQGNRLGRRASNHDITERKRAETALRELTTTLEAKVTQRTRELEYRASQLQKLTLELSQAEDRERRRLAEILHDDLQQQLAAAKFHLGILGGRIRGNTSVRNMVGLLDQILADAIEKSRSLSHELSPAVMYHGDLGEILEWLANQIRSRHGLIIHMRTDGQVDSQSDAMRAFLYKTAQELLFNIVKHARVEQADMRVRRVGRFICLVVSDRGRGFDPQELQATAGFGLFSLRERVQLLGGRMKIKSAKGKGSTFFIAVPDGELTGSGGRGGPESSREDAQPAPRPQRRLRVLVADDHAVVRQGLATLLREEQDMDVIGEATNGREAVNLAYELEPDVVVMDVAMPLMNGDEAARQILMHRPQTRIIAISMHEEPATIERMHRAGADSYVLKTAPSKELLATIRGKRSDL